MLSSKSSLSIYALSLSFSAGMFFPCVSKSAKVSVRFVFGANQGKLKFGPPEGHAAIAEALMPRDRLRIEPCFSLGQPEKGIFCGPTEPRELAVFIPVPVDTAFVQLPEHVEAVRDKLAVNLHELWAMRKVEQGWTFGDVSSLVVCAALPMTAQVAQSLKALHTIPDT